jgi:hypothetical protein
VRVFMCARVLLYVKLMSSASVYDRKKLTRHPCEDYTRKWSCSFMGSPATVNPLQDRLQQITPGSPKSVNADLKYMHRESVCKSATEHVTQKTSDLLHYRE